MDLKGMLYTVYETSHSITTECAARAVMLGIMRLKSDNCG